MSCSLPGWEMKILKLIHLPQAKNSPASLSKIKPLTLKSCNTTYSVQEDFQNSQTQNRLKSFKERPLTLISSSPASIPLSWTIAQQSHLGSLSFLAILNQPSTSGITEIGSLHMAHSSMWCGSSTCKERLSSSGTESALQPILPHQTLLDKAGYSTSTKQFKGGLDWSTMCHLTN